jgi:hypothetical protein
MLGHGDEYEAIIKFSMKLRACELALGEIVKNSRDARIREIARRALDRSAEIEVDFTFL